MKTIKYSRAKKILPFIIMGSLCVSMMTSCAEGGSGGSGGSGSSVNTGKEAQVSTLDAAGHDQFEIMAALSDKYVLFGSYPQEKSKPEPIEWLVLTCDENNRLLLLSKNVLAVKPYETDTGSSVTWADSDLREFLNGEFYESAFDDSEKNKILDAELVNDANYFGVSGGPDTTDKVFVPSLYEVISYVPLDSWNEDEIRGYASYLSTHIGDYAKIHKDPKTGKKIEYTAFDWELFWLRSPRETDSQISIIGMGSSCPVGNMWEDANKIAGVRPAIWIGADDVKYVDNPNYSRWQEKHEEIATTEAKREKYYNSEIYSSAEAYINDTMEELAPGSEFVCEMGRYLEWDDEKLSETVDTPEEALEFFETTGGVILGFNYAEAGVDPEWFINELLKRGIIGELPTYGDEYFEAWVFTIKDGEYSIDIYMTPGV